MGKKASSNNGAAGGCMECGKDDDHPNLLICENCAGEFHTYCLKPALTDIPDGDWYCARCSRDNDALEEAVSKLSSQFQRFGEVVFAYGGSNFGWWPCIIYDPRLTVGMARVHARSNLGKKHLVYFFECHDAPFAVLKDKALVSWDRGIELGYDAGDTAKGKNKQLFEKFSAAFQAALIEKAKPIEERMAWNHEKKESKSPTKAATKKRKNAAKGGNVSPNGDQESGAKKKRLRPSSRQEKEPPKPTRVGQRKRKKKKFGDEEVEEDDVSQDEFESKAEQIKQEYLRAFYSVHSTNRSASATIVERESSSTESALPDPAKDDGPLYCKVLVKVRGDPDLRNVGFIILPSRWHSLFNDARKTMMDELEEGVLPSEWKFVVPRLSTISERQESQLRIMPFLTSVAKELATDNGTSRHPVRLIVQNTSTILVEAENIMADAPQSREL